MPTSTSNLTNVPLPAGADRIGGWYDVDTSTPGRYFAGSLQVIERDNRDNDTLVLVDGTQWADGRIEQIISLDDDDLTVEQARQLAAALTAAADEVEQMSGYDRIEMAR